MNNKKSEVLTVSNWKIFFGIYVVGVIIMHFFMEMDYGDDNVSKQIAQGFTMLEWVIHRYNSWSARFIQEGLGFFMIWHPTLWKILDTIILIAIPLVFSYISGCKNVERYMCVSAFMMYPIIDMKSAGWICTTNTYLWPAFFGLLVGAFIKKYVEDSKNFKWYMVILFYVVLIIACNHELLAALLLGILIYCVGVYIYQNKCVPKVLLGAMTLAIINIIVILVSPGNHMREQLETNNWFADYANFSLIDKIYLGIARVFRILVMDMSPLFIALCCMVAIASVKLFDSAYKIVIGVLPMIMMFALKTVCTFYTLGDVMAIDYKNIYTYVPILFSVVMLVCLTVSFVELFKGHSLKESRFLPVVVLYGGLATTAAMGFSPTIYASGRRTSTFMFFALVYLVVEVLKRMTNEMNVLAKNEKTYCCLMWLMFIAFYGANLVVLIIN